MCPSFNCRFAIETSYGDSVATTVSHRRQTDCPSTVSGHTADVPRQPCVFSMQNRGSIAGIAVAVALARMELSTMRLRFFLGLTMAIGACVPESSPPLVLREATVSGVQAAFLDRSLSAEQLTDYYLERIERLDPTLRAVISIAPSARTRARELDQSLSRTGELVGRCTACRCS